MRVSMDCELCNERHETPRTTYQRLRDYMSGALVQDVWPSWTAQERDVVIAARNGLLICHECLDSIGGDNE